MIRFISSYRFASLLIALLLLSVGVFAAPLPWDAGSVKLAWFTVMLSLLAVSIVSCTVTRVRRELKRRRSASHRPAGNGAAFQYHSILSGEKAWSVVTGVLSVRGGNSGSEGSDRYGARIRGSAGVWGSIMFHGALLVIIAGIGMSAFTGMRTPVALTEGETIRLGGPLKNGDIGPLYEIRRHDGLTISMHTFEPGHSVGNTTTPASRLTVRHGRESDSGLIYVNRKFSLAGFSLHQTNHWGYSVGLLLRNGENDILFNGILRLAAPQERNSNRHQDHVVLPDGRRLQVELFSADRRGREGAIPAGEPPAHPTVRVRLLDGEQTVFTAAVTHGKEYAAEGWRLAFPELRYWSQLDITYDPGLPVMYLGFFLGIAGLGLRLLFVRSSIFVSVTTNGNATVVSLWGSAEKFQPAHQRELRKVFGTIKTALESADLAMMEQGEPRRKVQQEVEHANG